MADAIKVQVTEQPIILQYTKQGIEGPVGPVGPQGADGISWELAITMNGSPNGRCTMALYKNGYLCNETHYVEVQYCQYNSATFTVSGTWSGNISGTKVFDYTGVRMIKGTVFNNTDRETTLTTNTCNFGKSGTITVGNVEAVEQEDAYVTNRGTDIDAILDFGLPKGDEPVVSVGTTTAGGIGAEPQVTGREGNHNPVDLWLDFVIPNGVGMGAKVDEPQKNLIIEPGVFYTPDVSSVGVLSWTNNGDLENPASKQITPKPRGAWSSSTKYYRLDVVTNNGTSYIATTTVPAGTALTNTSYWQVIAERGTDGEDGGLLYATFEVNLTTGQLMMNADENYDGADFSIDSDGNLLVTI